MEYISFSSFLTLKAIYRQYVIDDLVDKSVQTVMIRACRGINYRDIQTRVHVRFHIE